MPTKYMTTVIMLNPGLRADSNIKHKHSYINIILSNKHKNIHAHGRWKIILFSFKVVPGAMNYNIS